MSPHIFPPLAVMIGQPISHYGIVEAAQALAVQRKVRPEAGDAL